MFNSRVPTFEHNTVVFNNDGGYILHKQTGRRMSFIERDGVYFVRMKMPGLDDMKVDLSANEQGDDPMSGFTRQEP